MTGLPMLSLAILLPVIGAILLLFVRNTDGAKDGLIRNVTLAVSLVTFAVTLALWAGFDSAPAGESFQFIERHPWIPAFGIEYFMGIDGLSLMLIVLTGFLTPIALLTAWDSIGSRVKEFSIFMLVLEAAMIGVFCALDLFLFYVFWDILLIPMYFLIGIWGYDQRVYAAVKFILYTLAGSVLMLVAIIGLSWMHFAATGQYSFNVLELYALDIPFNTQYWFFLAFALAFAIKVPLFPFHTWLPDAHVQAPTPGSVILAGVLLKMGGYGLIRFAFPLFPEAGAYFAPVIAMLSVVAIIYGALVAMVQPDMKKLVAYSSVSHMGFVVLGITTLNVQGIQGASFQMLAHGVSTGGLFALVGMMSDRRHTRLISEYGGIKAVMPKLTAAFLVITLASVGLPGMNGFVGEFLIMLGAFQWDARYAVGAGLGIILSAVYMLWMFQRLFYGPVTNDHNKHLPDLSFREWAVIGPLAAMAIVMGVFPNVFLKPMGPAVDRIVERVIAHQPASARTDADELRRGGPVAAHLPAPDSPRPPLTTSVRTAGGY
ncbi:MAG TPA: NADH-quinone oxidoreductase subunit M [Vicinamibacterales bacterium]|nr:NADH-quinone oxidoreductase subunit M [Vicinamibacterales bacterium]